MKAPSLNTTLLLATLVVSIVGLWLTWEHLQTAKEQSTK